MRSKRDALLPALPGAGPCSTHRVGMSMAAVAAQEVGETGPPLCMELVSPSVSMSKHGESEEECSATSPIRSSTNAVELLCMPEPPLKGAASAAELLLDEPCESCRLSERLRRDAGERRRCCWLACGLVQPVAWCSVPALWLSVSAQKPTTREDGYWHNCELLRRMVESIVVMGRYRCVTAAVNAASKRHARFSCNAKGCRVFGSSFR